MTISLIFFLMAAAVYSETPSGERILKKVDANSIADNRIAVGEMVIHGRRGQRSIKMKSWIEGTEKSFTEYLSPAREKGTKMLKLKDQLWMYSPSTDRTIMISGHMLRQSVMGSDLSYEDLMEDPKLNNVYTAEVIGEETYLQRPCWVLNLTSRKKDAAYTQRKIWVDRDRYLALKEERYARSGKLLKTTEVKNVIRKENRWVAALVVFKDVLKKGQGTEFHLESIEFNASIPKSMFSKAALRK